MNRIKVLYVSYDGMTDPLGQSQVIPYLVGLSKLGCEIHILSAEKTINFEINNERIKNSLDANGIFWHPVNYTKKPPVISTVLDIFKLLRKAEKLHKTNNFEIIHCRSYISAFIGLSLKKKYGVKFLFDMRGFYADERLDGGLWPQSNPLYRIVYKYFKTKEKDFLSNADYVVSLTSNGKNIIKNDFGFRYLPIEVIPCCADVNHFNYNNVDVATKNKYICELGLSNADFVLLYLGSLGTWYMPEEMLKFFSVLKNKMSNAKFLIITRDDPSLIYSLAEKFDLKSEDILIHPANYPDIPALISLANLAIFFIKPVFSKKASSPTKLAELLGMGIPVICNSSVGDLDIFFKEYELGILIKEFTEEEYLNTVERIEELKNIPKEQLRQIACNLFSLDEGIKKYFNIYKNLTGLSN
ncbi:MAG TPA: glycosyltransferase [Bacteroidales bacterium]|nr:glycosyltransferase [Bacteroidales bacterium]HOL98507.1 glycosyltransferase [Bacteroidales bacterium]HPD23445.1 glycosyltransferase [Bacteroidales bacterium]HRS99577.1 glycosyltransferase [Bacteroidales bacterium]HRT79659.1 glycosyltransferase [Bacteroidales bacterium]